MHGKVWEKCGALYEYKTHAVYACSPDLCSFGRQKSWICLEAKTQYYFQREQQTAYFVFAAWSNCLKKSGPAFWKAWFYPYDLL